VIYSKGGVTVATENSNRSGKDKRVWFIDHQQLDIVLSDSDGKPIGERPWVTAVMEEGGYIQGMWVSIERPDVNSIERTLKEARLTADTQRPSDGWPLALYIDNSPPSSDCQEIVQSIQIMRAAPGKPQGKGIIERTFGILGTRLLLGQRDVTTSPITLQQIQRVLAAYILDYHARIGSDNSGSQD
jgi:hypothetical protein